MAAPSQRQTPAQVPGWSTSGRDKHAPTLSPPPLRTEEQPPACSIRWSFNGWQLSGSKGLVVQVTA